MRLPSRQNPSVFHEENEQNGIVEGLAKNCKTVSATAGFLGIYVGREKRIQYRALHLRHAAEMKMWQVGKAYVSAAGVFFLTTLLPMREVSKRHSTGQSTKSGTQRRGDCRPGLVSSRNGAALRRRPLPVCLLICGRPCHNCGNRELRLVIFGNVISMLAQKGGERLSTGQPPATCCQGAVDSAPAFICSSDIPAVL